METSAKTAMNVNDIFLAIGGFSFSRQATCLCVLTLISVAKERHIIDCFWFLTLFSNLTVQHRLSI